MLTIILPGLSPRNREWGYEVKDNLKLDHEVIVHEWEHWKEKSLSLSIRREREKILKKIGSNKVNIIAKSVGTRVLMHLIPIIKPQLQKVILCGIPTRFESETPKKLYKEGLTLLSPAQVAVFQNESDPLAHYSVIEIFIHSVNPKIEVIKMPRSDHHYPYSEDFNIILNNF